MFRFALRLLLKKPGSSLMAILVVMVGTGVCTTMFAFVSGILWSPLGLNENREILNLEWSTDDKLHGRKQIHPLDYEALKSETQSFQKLTSMRWDTKNFYVPDGQSFASRYELSFVEHNFFDFINEHPLLGRTFRPEDAIGGNEDKLIISYAVWQEHFGGDPDAIGATAMLDGKPCTIVGVMPKGFLFPDEVHIWVASDWTEAKTMDRRSWHRVHALGVLKPGLDPEDAKADLATIARNLERTYPDTNDGQTAFTIKPYSEWLTTAVTSEKFKQTCYALLLCSLLVLGVASSNLFNLVMTRTATRTTELSIRNAMGASRKNIIGQVVFDGLILASIGSLLGTVLSHWGLKLIWSVFSQQIYVPYWWKLELNAQVIGFVVFVTLATTIAATLIPGLRASRSSVATNLREDARTSTGLFLGKLSKLVLSFQIFAAGGLVFVSVAMLIVWFHLKQWNTSYDADHIINGSLQLSSLDKSEDEQAILRFTKEFKERIARYPNPATIAFSSEEAGAAAPGGMWIDMKRFEFEGESYQGDELRPEARRVVISEGFEEVFDIKTLRGRTLKDTDTQDSQLVCVVNEHFATRYWKDTNPIGKRIKFFDANDPDNNRYHTVVGVTANVSPDPLPGQNLVKDGFAKIYIPIDQAVYIHAFHVLLRSSGNPFEWTLPLQKELRSMNPELAFHGRFMTVQGVADRNNVSKDLIFSMFGIFGLASLFLGIGGMYAVVSFSTRQRFREFAIRRSLGATSPDILKIVLGQGAPSRLIAAALGLATGHLLANSLKSMIGLPFLPVGLSYPITFLILATSIAVSMLIPALQATRLSPMQAMRSA